MNIYVSTGAFKSKSLKEVLDLASKNEIWNIELAPGLDYDPRTIEILNDAKNEFAFLVHNYFPTPEKAFALNLASNNKEIERLSVGMCMEAIDICAELRIPYYSVHCGFCFDTDGSALGSREQIYLKRIPYEEAKCRFVANVNALCNYGKKKAVGIAIENNVAANFAKNDRQLLLGVDGEEIRELLYSIDSDNISFLMDLAHAKVSSNTYKFDLDKFIDETINYVKEVHVSENDGVSDQNIAITSEGYLYSKLSKYKNKTVTLEVYNLEIDEILSQIRIVEEAISRG